MIKQPQSFCLRQQKLFKIQWLQLYHPENSVLQEATNITPKMKLTI